jgi:hypothetical protein
MMAGVPGKSYSLIQVAEALGGRPPAAIRGLQQKLKLPRPAGERYSEGYVALLRRILALRAFSVPLDEIAGLLTKEKRLQELLHADSVASSPTWFLECCGQKGRANRRLMLTGYDTGFPLEGNALQPGFDFGTGEQELFSGREMGEDVRRAVSAYVKERRAVLDRLARERPVLRFAQRWVQQQFARR